MKTLMARMAATTLALTALACLPTVSLHAEEAAGNWGGLLAGQLHIVVHVTKDGNGRYAASLESPDQGTFVLAASDVAVTPDHLAFAIGDISARYDGAWSPAQGQWLGAWTQQSQSMPLNLTRLTTATDRQPAIARPQEDAILAGPPPYRQSEATFTNPTGNVTLAGTLSVPAGKGPFPAVILVSGSGPQTRDEDVLGHRIFLVLSDALTRRGIAVLRYDKRGVGASTGDFATATSPDFASDVEAGLDWLKTCKDIDPGHIGLIGHSEGGAIVPSVAVRHPEVAFSVLMAAPGLRTDRLTVLQTVRIARASGVPEAAIAKLTAFLEHMLADVMAAPSDDDALRLARADAASAVADGVIPAASAEETVRQVASPWSRQALAYDPVPTLRRLTTPVLAVTGSLDLQVPATENLALITEALAANPDATVMVLPGLNHMFQTAATGAPAEYGAITETMAPAALSVIVDWVAAHAHP